MSNINDNANDNANDERDLVLINPNPKDDAGDEHDLAWGAEELAPEFGLDRDQFYYKASRDQLWGIWRSGRDYVGSRSAIRAGKPPTSASA